MKLLCAIGLHARIRDRDVPTKWGIFSYTDEYTCRRCTGRWERFTVFSGGGLWERIG